MECVQPCCVGRSHAFGSDRPGQFGDTGLANAAFNGKVEAIRALVELGSNLETTSSVSSECAGESSREWLCLTAPSLQNGYTPLSRAASKGHIEAIRALVELGADLEAKDKVRHAGALSSLARAACA